MSMANWMGATGRSLHARCVPLARPWWLRAATTAALAVGSSVWWLTPPPPAAAQAPVTIDFARDVQPLLRAHCYGCHGPALQSGGLRLDRRRDPMPNRVGANRARIVPGRSGDSQLYLRVAGSDAGLQMPPAGPLQPEEIRLIRDWIDQGAEWPDHLAGDTPSPPDDPLAVQVMDALRRGDRRSVERLLRANPAAARSRGTGGSTPLMYAALYGDAGMVRRLLDRGADPNARNDAGATALLWAVDDARTTRLLLERGADPNVRSDDGPTPLLLAANRFGARDVIAALLDHGAVIEGPVLGRAAAAGDEAAMRLLIARGAEPRVAPGDLAVAMQTGCAACVDLVLASATPEDLSAALLPTARHGDSNGVRLLLERGAAATGEALQAAAASDRAPVAAIAALLDRGARDGAALEFARRHGDTAVVPLLEAAARGEAPAAGMPVSAAASPGASASAVPAGSEPASTRPGAAIAPREAVLRSLPLLQRTDVVFLQKAGCVSCHHNSQFLMTAAVARANGFELDEAVIRSQLQVTAAYLESFRERALQDTPIPGSVDTVSYILAALATARYPADPATDALARFLVRRQAADGRWRVLAHRPPIESSDFGVTALTLRSLRAYAPAPRRSEYDRAARRGVAWLREAAPESTEDHVFQVLGLAWAGESRGTVRRAAQRLIALQRADGGWGQIPTLPSDAYATGQALTALAEVMPTSDPVYQKGVRFLLSTQFDDGSWHVRSRVIPFQPYFESEFPHGRDQFISAAATNWATMALAPAAR
jgi:ankyrin repeat protein